MFIFKCVHLSICPHICSWHPNCLQSCTHTLTLPRNKESSYPDVTTMKSIMFQAFLKIVNSIVFTFVPVEGKWTGMGSLSFWRHIIWILILPEVRILVANKAHGKYLCTHLHRENAWKSEQYKTWYLYKTGEKWTIG